MIWPIDPIEWDFRRVPENEIDDCIWWEYLRESDHAPTAVSILNQEIQGKTARDWLLLEPCHPMRRMSERSIRSAFGWGKSGLLIDYPFFPMPWQKFKKIEQHKTPTSTITTGPLLDEVEKLRAICKETRGCFLESEWTLSLLCGDQRNILQIDFSNAQSLEQIQNDFAHWLKTEVKRLGIKFAQGKAAQPKAKRVLLKNLAALRLYKCIKYDDQTYQQLVDYEFKTKDEHKKDRNDLPIFAESNKWFKAVNSAKNYLARNYSTS